MALIPIPPSAPTRVMIGATAVADGKAGSVTKPLAGDHLKFARGDGTWATVSAASDRRNSTTSRANATAGVAPTVGEHASPIDGDTHTIILNNGNVEYYKYTTVWGLVATVVPVSFDGSHTPISRANALTNIAPTIGEVPSPVEGDSASVFLNDGTIENWYRNATVWALINTITPVTSDGNSVWIPRANATTGVAPTVGEVSAPVSGDTAIVLLNNGTKEYWTRATVWTLTATEVAAAKDGRVVWVSRGNTSTGNAPTGVEVVSPVNGDSAIVILSNWTKEYWSYVLGAWALTTTEVVGANDGRTIWLPRANATTAVAPTVGEVATPISGDAAMVILNNGVKEYWAYTTVWTLVATETPSASSADTIQTAATTGTTAITAWGSVVLIPTLAANITLTYPTPVGNIGKTIKVVRTGTPNGFTVTHTPAVGTLTLMSTGSEINTAAGAFTVEAIDATNIRQVSNATSAATTTALTFGRVKATATLASTSFSITAPGTKVPFDTAFYFSGTTVGTDSITVSQTGRYRCSWFMLCGSGEFNGDGTFHVVSGGVSLGSVFVDMMQAAGVNQVANFIDVNADAGSTLSLHYQPVVADSVPWGAGSYFQVDQLPTTVAPVVNTVAEYGSSVLAAVNVDVNVSVGNWVTLAGLSTTLPSAGTYRLFWKASGEMADAGTTEVVVSGRLRNNTSGVDYTDSRAVIVGKDSPTASVFTSIATGSGEVIVTVTTTSEIVFQTRTSALATVSSVILGDGNLRSAAYISYEKIAGQLPSTGATVDYVNARLTTSPAIAAGAAFPFVTQTGNIPNASGVFTLSAGKTYRLTASAAYLGTEGSAGLSIRWKDITNNAFIGSQGVVISGNLNTAVSSLPIAEAVITPTANIQVHIETAAAGAARTFTGGQGNGDCWATIVQIGSTNTVGGNTNVNDQSSAGYFDTGNKREQWGTTASVANNTTITLPAPFANTNYSLSGVVVGNGTALFTTQTVTASTFTVNLWNTNGGGATSGIVKWHAIGQKP